MHLATCLFTVARNSDSEDCYILAVFYLFSITDFSTSMGRFSRNFAIRRGVF